LHSLAWTLTQLEREPTHYSVKHHSIPLIKVGIQQRVDIQGEASSPLHLTPNTHFIIRIDTRGADPATLIHLFQLHADKQGRYYITGDISGYVFTDGKSTGPQPAMSQLQFAKYGKYSLEIIPAAPLPPGEYAFITGFGYADCFQADPHSVSVAAPPVQRALPLPSPSPPATSPLAPACRCCTPPVRPTQAASGNPS
jgi:hypothetical protein